MNQGRILVVDDEESIRFTFETFLSEEGHRVETASSYDEGRDLVERERFDLVFIDIILEGGRSGMALLEDITELAPETETIIITGAPTVKTASGARMLRSSTACSR